MSELNWSICPHCKYFVEGVGTRFKCHHCGEYFETEEVGVNKPHIFVPEKEKPGIQIIGFCEICGEYLTHPAHIKKNPTDHMPIIGKQPTKKEE